MQDSDSDQIEANTQLFNLIRKKNLTSEEKLKKIEGLLNETPTPNIDACDGNYNDNTPLHMAVKRKDLVIIEFILARGASTTIKNRDGYTALELAKNLECEQDILAALTRSSTLHFPQGNVNNDHTENSLYEQYIEEHDFTDSPHWSIIQSKIKDPKFKILKIYNATVKEVVDFMCQETFFDMFNQSTHLFLIVIRIDGSLDVNEDTLKPLEYLLETHKPIIFQWETSCSSKCQIFFKPPYKSIMLLNQEWGKCLTEEELIEELTPEDSFQLQLLLKALHFGFGGSFENSLLGVRFDVKREFDTWRFIDYAARSDDALSLRFLLLAEWNLSEPNEGEYRVLEIATEYSSPQGLSALLDLPSGCNPEKLAPTCSQINLLTLRNSNGHTPFLINAQCGKPESLMFLIYCGLGENYSTAIQFAWHKQRFDNVLVLLNAEAPFPIGFKKEKLGNDKCSLALQELISCRENFHQAIKENSNNGVEYFTKKFPQTKIAYNCYNQSALITAVKENQYDIFSRLQSKGFRVTDDEEQLLSNLADRQKEKLKHAKSKYFKKQDNSHIIYLLSKSKIGHEGDYSQEVKDIFEELDDLPYISTVLKVLELSNLKEIIFDFNKNSVVDLDPTQSSTVSGICDYVTGTLYVGAKQQSRETLIGTIAHELAHLAMQCVYNNECNPYTLSDIKTKTDFKEIVDYYHNMGDTVDPIIARVFTNYINPNDWPSELVVRVPHLIGHYRTKIPNEHLTNINTKAPKLFEFYYDRIEKELVEFIERPAHFRNQRLNDLLGQLTEIQNHDIRLNEDCLLSTEDLDSEINLVLYSSLPYLFKIGLLQSITRKEKHLSIIKSHYIFATIAQFNNPDLLLKIRESFKSNIKQTLIVDCTYNYYSNHDMLWKTIFSFPSDKKIIFIGSDHIVQHLSSRKDIQMDFIEGKFVWTELTPNSQTKILEQEIHFQGYNIPLNKLMSPSSKHAKLLPLEDLLNEGIIKIGNALLTFRDSNIPHHIERTLNEISTKNLLGIEASRFGYDRILQSYTPDKISKLLLRLKDKKILLIADQPGIGKTVALTYFCQRIKEQDPSTWVMRFDLGKHKEALKNLTEKGAKEMSAIEFLCDKLLRVKSLLEKIIFVEALDNAKIVLMLDGFDEISPLYTKLMMNILTGLRESTIGQLWLTTRPLFRDVLVKEYDPILCVIEPLSEENQLNFLINFWKIFIASRQETMDETKIRNYAIEVLRKVSESIQGENIASIPQYILLLAEVFKRGAVSQHQITDKLNLVYLYERFISMKYNIYLFEKIKNAKDMFINIHDVNLRKTHQQLALQFFFADERNDLLSSKKQHTLVAEEINRIGIVQSNGTTLYFEHITFAEYFVANFFAEQLIKLNIRLPFQITLFRFFLQRILLNMQYIMIRKFINNFLALTPTLPIESYKLYGQEINERIEEILERGSMEKYTIFHLAVQERNRHIIQLLMKALISKNYIHTLKNLLEREDMYNRTPWLIAIEYGYLDVLDTFWASCDDISKILPENYLKTVLLYENSVKQSMWSFSVANNNVESFDWLMKHIKTVNLDKNDIKNLFLSMQVTYTDCLFFEAVSKKQTWVFNRLLTIANEFEFSSADYKDLLFINEITVQHPAVPLSIIESEKWKLGNILHFAAKGGSINAFHELSKWIQNAQLEMKDIQKLVCLKNRHLETIWHCAVSSNSDFVETPLRTWTNYNVKLDFKSEDSKTGILKELWKWSKDAKVTANELAKLSLEENRFGYTIWHLVLSYNDITMAKELFGLIRNEVEINTKEYFAQLMTRHSHSLWICASSTGDIETLNIIWEWIEEANLSSESIKGIVSTKCWGQNILHNAITRNELDKIEHVYKRGTQAGLTQQDLRDVLSARNNIGATIWQLGMQTNSRRIFSKLLKLTKTFIPPNEELKDLLLEQIFDGKSTWHLLIEEACCEMLNVLLELIPEPHICKEFIVFRSRNNETVFHLAAKSKSERSFEYVLKFLKTAKIDQSQVVELIASRDSNNNTAITLAANRKMYKTVLVLIEMSADLKTLNKIQLNKLKGLVQPDKNREALMYNIEYHLRELLKNEQKNQMQEDVDEFCFSITDLYT